MTGSGAEEPDPIKSLGIRPWRPALLPVLAEIDPKGPAQSAGLKTGDRLISMDGQPLNEWQQVVDRVRERPEAKVSLRIERDGVQMDVPVTLSAKGEGKAAAGYLGLALKLSIGHRKCCARSATVLSPRWVRG